MIRLSLFAYFQFQPVKMSKRVRKKSAKLLESEQDAFDGHETSGSEQVRTSKVAVGLGPGCQACMASSLVGLCICHCDAPRYLMLLHIFDIQPYITEKLVYP